ncbi:MAG: hypothetical protein IJ774_14610 [Selenomonadaceae bacterium]|nr:hypothetical protein [Selenomonadaceae bacterium]
MPKKIFCAALTVAIVYFAAVLIFVNAASAEDVWIDSYSSRVQCYVMTDTFVNRTQYRDNRAFSVDVKFVGATVAVHNYSFRENDGLIYFSVDGGADNFIDSDKLAARIWEFGLDFLGINYEVRYD